MIQLMLLTHYSLGFSSMQRHSATSNPQVKLICLSMTFNQSHAAIFNANRFLWLLTLWQTLPFLHIWCLRSDWDDRCVNIWKIACRNLHKSARLAVKKCILASNQFSFLPMQSFPIPSFLSVAFNHRSLTPILLTQPDPSWHMSSVLTPWWRLSLSIAPSLLAF